MMLEIINICKIKSVSRVELSVDTHNLKAIKLYKSVGFTKEGILKNYTFLKSKNKFIDEQIMSNLISKQYNCTKLTSTNKIYKMQILSYFMVLLSNQLKLKFKI
ncbi:GNAT family N-acetyltransferase [Flavobacterium sp. RSP15]|uniref:GNAT family N-acetyltransferase n=2 Tax=unclassified Flavobacterium TaxID=196869 RepID=UPI000F841459|nr:N-acetyltransferase [Flavobacterium sp. RSP15]